MTDIDTPRNRISHQRVPPLSRLSQLERPPELDFPSIVERLKRSCGTNTVDLAAALQLKARHLNQIELGDREPTWSEGDLLLRAVDACGGNLSDPTARRGSSFPTQNR